MLIDWLNCYFHWITVFFYVICIATKLENCIKWSVIIVSRILTCQCCLEMIHWLWTFAYIFFFSIFRFLSISEFCLILFLPSAFIDWYRAVSIFEWIIAFIFTFDDKNLLNSFLYLFLSIHFPSPPPLPASFLTHSFSLLRHLHCLHFI